MCGFACGAGTDDDNDINDTWCNVDIDSGDGLPVELMEFSVETEEPEE